MHDFTEANYRHLLCLAKRHYRFESFGTRCVEPHVLWRHDIDFSTHRALRIAEIEAEESIRSTFFVLLHSEFYNALEKTCTEHLRQILAQGHQLGLHFDAGFYPGCDTPEALEAKVLFEKGILEHTLEAEISVLSFHNPDTGIAITITAEQVGGLINTYGRSIQEKYSYCSDSNGYWRYRRLQDVLEAADEPYLQILTHPAWWTPEALSPRDRVTRCIDGRAHALHRAYDDFLKRHGRLNIGAES